MSTQNGKQTSSDPLGGERAGGIEKERVAKVMARAGLCSRRDAESWIKAGRVAVNGTIITSPALNIGPDETVTVDGNTVEARERTRLFLYHKPRGLVTTARDPEGRQTVFDNLPDWLPRLVSIGRLDINTEGLLLLTNDGGLARVLELPSTGWLRRYRVRANGKVTPDQLEALKDGITIDGMDYAGIEATLDRGQGANVWLTMGLREGKNREIKRVLEHLGLYVNRLIRLSFGPFQLGELAEGDVEEVRTRVLRDQLGDALAREAGAEWDDPATAPVVTMARQEATAAMPARTERKRSGKAERPARSAAPERPAAPEPRRDRPPPKARPHVSALRAERPTSGEEPRKRTARSKTEDRKGRTVAIERITTAEKKTRHAGEGGTTRNARNFAREHRDALGDSPEAGRRPREESRSQASREGPQRSRGFGSDRPATGRAVKDNKTRSSGKAAPGKAAPGRATPGRATPGKAFAGKAVPGKSRTGQDGKPRPGRGGPGPRTGGPARPGGGGDRPAPRGRR